MTSNESPKQGWSTPKQYAGCVAACTVFAVALITFVRTASPIGWEQASFSQTQYAIPSPFERALAAHTQQPGTVATAGTAAAETQ